MRQLQRGSSSNPRSVSSEDVSLETPLGSLALGGSRFRRFLDGFTHGLSFRHFFLALRRPLEPLLSD